MTDYDIPGADLKAVAARAEEMLKNDDFELHRLTAAKTFGLQVGINSKMEWKAVNVK